MRLGTVIDISLVDVPDIPVTVIFTAGCNFDCPYCQNAELIPLDSGIERTPEQIAVEAQGHLTDGYCITGGEPTVYKDLPDLLKILALDPDKHINLNTQGSVPTVLERSLPYLDSVWLDFKTIPQKYRAIARTRGDPWPRVKKSITMLMDSDVAFWPRTTYVGTLMTPEDIAGIMETLSFMGFEGTYLVQNYRASDGTRPEEVKDFTAPDVEELDSVVSSAPSGIDVRLEWR